MKDQCSKTIGIFIDLANEKEYGERLVKVIRTNMNRLSNHFE